jgi:VanZ family protein
MKSFFQFWVRKPKEKLWLILPFSYTLFLQILTGFPKPDSLKNLDANKLFVRFSEELFDYPFWLQDLSHFPLFFTLAWLWSWQLGCIEKISKCFIHPAFLFSCFYAIANEMAQAFIPDRFPSPGDLIMNLAGVLFGLASHSYFCQRSYKQALGKN